MKRILTVCNGNIHRSVIAALCIEKQLKYLRLNDQYQVFSRGLQGSDGTLKPKQNIMAYPLEWSFTRPILEELEIVVPGTQISIPIDERDIVAASLVLAMDRKVLSQAENSLVKQFPAYQFKMKLFTAIAGLIDDIPDCCGKEQEKPYRDVCTMIDLMVRENIDNLLHLTEVLSLDSDTACQRTPSALTDA